MSGRFVRSVCAAALVASTVLAMPAPMAGAAPTGPPDRSVSALLNRLQTLYRQAEEATETYNATAEKLKRQRVEVDKLNDELADARIALTGSRNDAGRLAREQYRGTRGSSLSPYMEFLLGSDPQQAMDRSHEIARAAGRRASTVDRLADGEQRAAALASRAREALNTQQTLAAGQKKQQDAVRRKLSEVEQLLASLTPGQLADVRLLEQRGISDAQRKLLSSGALGGAKAPSRAGGKALEYAYQQVGKPYVWGAAGPDSFDCSGLTSQAWAHAGGAIPRTSQDQWKSLPRVPLNELRPGDLVLYFEGATHVALYIGNGQVIQAPRPGAYVKVSPIAANPLLGAVRPDAGQAPMSSYVPPELPDGAAAGEDTGYGPADAPGR
ncbi:NlpC/P60 family protein [Streptomyces sp. NPDC026206]|uniref:C40 family peptidase n=1 Tax=Streptomyces sp. NPDC026206 TaxID=3157089 RepID=UPI0033D275BB